MAFRILGAESAAALDKELMSKGGFSIDQLMELAGLSVSQAIYKKFPPIDYPKLLILVGPGNNGGDGLVASRHLKLLGYDPIIYYPKKTKGELFDNLLVQLKYFGIREVHDSIKIENMLIDGKIDCIVDSLFGFSFKPPIRDPFKELIDIITDKKIIGDIPIVSVDIPSGWDVTEGPITENYIKPDVLVSLTAPKKCSLKFEGSHFVGGRFIPEYIAEKYEIDIPDYEGIDQVVQIVI